MANPSNSRSDLLAADQALVEGIQKNQALLPASFRCAKKQMTPQDVINVVQGRITTGKAVVAAEAARTAAVKADKDERAQTGPVVAGFKRMLLGMFAEEPGVLADFDVKAPKPAAKSAAVKAKAAEKAAATRKVLGTKGKLQKKAAIAAEASAPAQAQAAAPPAPAVPATAPAMAPSAASAPHALSVATAASAAPAAPLAQPSPAAKPQS
jgi:hypothetical protein